MNTTGGVAGVTRQLDHHRMRGEPFASFAGAGDLCQRSAAVRESLFAPDVPPVNACVEWPPEFLAVALFTALTTGRPLVFTPSARTGPPACAPIGRDAHWVLARAGSPLAVPAALFAAATGKRFAIIEPAESLDSALGRHEYCSAIVVDEPEVFTKPVLHRLAAAVRPGMPDALPPAVMTAFSVRRFSHLVWRSLAYRNLRTAGGGYAQPPAQGPVSLRTTGPLDYYILSGHGDELHIDHSDDEIICGSFSLDDGDTGLASPMSFGCAPACPYPGSIRASDVPVATMILLSCDSATFGDGFAPRGYSVLLGLLDGWCTSAIAPYKHAMLAPELELLTSALVDSGHCLGEITDRLNTIAGPGAIADAPFVVVGDPEAVPARARRTDPAPAEAIAHSDCVVVTAESGGGHTLDCVVPPDRLDVIGPAGTRLAVEPVSPELTAPGLRFVLRQPSATDGLGVIVFGPAPLPSGPLRFRVRRAVLPDPGELSVARRQLHLLSSLSAHGLEPALLARIVHNAAALLDGLSGYPRAGEHLLGHDLLSHYEVVLTSTLRGAREGVLHGLIERMAAHSFWISHRYSECFADTGRFEDSGSAGTCPDCGNVTDSWRYSGGVLGMAPRGPRVCPRCGIISDTPLPSAFEASFSPAAPLVALRTQRRLTVRNLSPVTQELAISAQFNEWRTHEIAADPPVTTMVLAPGERGSCCFDFTFGKSPHEDLITAHAFVLTGECELYCYTQRALLCHGGPPPVAPSQATTRTNAGIPIGAEIGDGREYPWKAN